jgi:hypothetical protein
VETLCGLEQSSKEPSSRRHSNPCTSSFASNENVALRSSVGSSGLVEAHVGPDRVERGRAVVEELCDAHADRPE